MGGLKPSKAITSRIFAPVPPSSTFYGCIMDTHSILQRLVSNTYMYVKLYPLVLIFR